MNSPEQNAFEMLAQVKNFFVDAWENIAEFFTSYQFKEIVFTIKIILILISIFLVAIIFGLLCKIIITSMLSKPLYKSRKPKPAPIFNKKKIRKRWEKVEKRLKTDLEANCKLALIEADKIFDRVIKELGYGVEKKLPNADGIKAANKLKNKIIDDKKLKLSKSEAETAVGEYKKGLEELGML